MLLVSGNLAAGGFLLIVPCCENSDSNPCSVEGVEAWLLQAEDEEKPVEASVLNCEPPPGPVIAPSGQSALRCDSDLNNWLNGGYFFHFVMAVGYKFYFSIFSN